MSSSRIFIFLFSSLLAFSLCATNQLACQDSATGAIRGTVFDSTGSRVAAGIHRRREYRERNAIHSQQRQRRTLRA